MVAAKNTKQNSDTHGLNVPGFLYLSDAVLAKVKEATGDAGKGTVDELKLGPLYDTMSNLLFPWCSTLTSRARYFYFSYAVLKLALDATVAEKVVNPDYDRHEVAKLAGAKLGEFRKHVRRIEKFLALALHLKDKQDGAAGRNKVTRWCAESRDIVKASRHSMILSLDGRYPNAIYRAPCKTLNLFVKENHNLGLLKCRLLGYDPFSAAWSNAGRFALKELERIVEFWEDRSDDPLVDVAQAFRDSLACKSFRGFQLLPGEALFLYDRIGERTAYWASISASSLSAMFRAPIDFEILRDAVTSEEKEYFDAANHIDIATRSFRHYYAEIVLNPDHPPSLTEIKEALPQIQKSVAWLDRHSGGSSSARQQWAEQWALSYSALIAGWAMSISAGPSSLARDLKLRAETVVAGRGHGKLAPHHRRKDEADIDKELNLEPSSFRLSNAIRILKDISNEIRHG